MKDKIVFVMSLIFAYTVIYTILTAIGVGYWFLFDWINVPVSLYKGSFCLIITLITFCIIGSIIERFRKKNQASIRQAPEPKNDSKKYGESIGRTLPSYIQVKVYGRN